MEGYVRGSSQYRASVAVRLTPTSLFGHSGHGQDVRCVDWHPTKGLIVSGSTDDKVSFWDPRSGQALAS